MQGTRERQEKSIPLTNSFPLAHNIVPKPVLFSSVTLRCLRHSKIFQWKDKTTVSNTNLLTVDLPIKLHLDSPEADHRPQVESH